MRKSRFTDEQIVAMLREADRTSVAETAKKHKVSEQTIYVWRKHFAGVAPADVKRLKALELENAKLKRLLAERDLEVDITREVNRKAHKPRANRSASSGNAVCRNGELVGCWAYRVRSWVTGCANRSRMPLRWPRCGGFRGSIRGMATAGFVSSCGGRGC
jgi:putative transposase